MALEGEMMIAFVAVYLCAALGHDALVHHLKLISAVRRDPLHRTAVDEWLLDHETFAIWFGVTSKAALLGALVWFAVISRWWYAILLWAAGFPIGIFLLHIADVTVGLRRLSLLSFVIEPVLIIALFACLIL